MHEEWRREKRSTMVVALSVGHVGRIDKDLRDYGCSAGNAIEGELAHEYSLEAAKLLRAAGHRVFIQSFGEYADRIEFAHSARADVYVSCHVNSAESEGDYGLVLYDGNVENADALAIHLASSLEAQKRRVHDAASYGNWRNAYNCISLCYYRRPFGIVYEPFFIQQYVSAPEKYSPKIIGAQLATGLLNYWGSR